MRKLASLLTTLLALSFIATATPANSTALQMGVSVDEIPVSSGFNGTDIIVFGSIEGVSLDALNRGEYSVVVKVTGGIQDVTIRQKARKLGIWVNSDSEKILDVPAFYAVVSDKPLVQIADAEVLGKYGLGIDNLGVAPVEGESAGFILKEGQFSDALRRIKRENGLFAEDYEGLTQLSPSLFRARVELPPNVPIGTHEVTAYLFRGGQHLYAKSVTYKIGKVGFERWIYNLAHEQSFLYGIMAVLLAIFTGWAANAIFRKN